MTYRRKTPKRNMRALRALVDLSSIGIYMVVATFAGGGIGYGLDHLFGTFPWLSLPFLLLGIAAGFLRLFEAAKTLGENDEHPDDENP